MFAFADTDGDGSLSFQEFEVIIDFKKLWMISLKKMKRQRKLSQVCVC